MEHRYSLRFESGERRGESIPVTGAGLTIGRKPGNTLQILDNSVSGSHAEIVVDEDGVTVRDSGSTNGTRVGTQRVIEQQLQDGDTVLFGNVRLTFHDAGAQATAPVPAGRAPARKADAGRGDTVRTTMEGVELEGLDVVAETAEVEAAVAEGAVLRVSAETMARSRKRSFAGGLVVIALALAGGGVWWWLNRGGGAAEDAGRIVVPVTGNLIPQGYSFESDDDGWSPIEGGSAAFLKTGTSRRSGAFGLGVDLEPGQWAVQRSSAVRATAGTELVATGWLRARGGCEARLGIELSNDLFADAAAPAAVTAWSAPVTGARSFEPVEVRAVVPAGWSQARVVILAHAGGKDPEAGGADADDVALIEGARDAQPAARAGNAAVFALGDPPTSAQLVQGPSALVTHVAATAGAADAMPWDDRPLRVHGEGLVLRVEPAGSGAGAMQLRVEEPLARARVATMGAEGYRTHGLDFERAGVDALLLGNGANLVRVKLAGPSQVKGLAQGSATRITIVPAQPLEMQLDFAAERKEAGNIAYAARAAESSGDLGAAVAKWSALLDGYPFDDALVNEAEAARSRLVQKGLEELRRVQNEVERARFFRMADLYRKCRNDALAVAAKYTGSEVETQARALAEGVAADVAALEVDQDKAVRERMLSVLAALEARQATGLANEMRAYLAQKYGARAEGARSDREPSPGAPGRGAQEDGLQKNGDGN